MARTAEQYRQLLSSLMPKGDVWSIRIASYIQKLLFGSADEFVRVEGRAEDLFDEQDVRSAVELLDEHEDDYGLPLPGEEISSITSERQAELEAALLKVGQQFPQYYIDIAAALGYTVTVEQYTPFWVGVGACGDPIGDQVNIFWWKICIDVDSVTRSAEVNITKLMSRIRAAGPGHAHVVFDFVNAEYGRGFSSAFDSIPSYDNSWLNGEFSRDFSNAFANAYDYDGVNYTGAFSKSFCIAYDRDSGGNFGGAFDVSFNRPQ